MESLKCPNCGSVFTVDEDEYASILNQVKNREFESEVQKRVSEAEALMKAKASADKAVADSREAELRHQLQVFDEVKKAELAAAIARKDLELSDLRKLANDAVLKEQQRVALQVTELQAEVQRLSNEAQLKAKDAELQLSQQKESYEQQLRLKDEQVKQYKDFRFMQATKLVGESLEQHCENLYEEHVRIFMRESYFGKDNDASSGTKGDYIFRYVVDGNELTSAMFEMKNESETSDAKNKHKNADFFKKLDEDRRKKGCEYAILVSMLEKDNERYNNGIVVVPEYEKMFVVRPQCFLPMLHILRQSANTVLDYKQKLEIAQRQSADVTNFEARMSEFARIFGNHCVHAAKQREEALKYLDTIITACNNAKEALRLEGSNYDKAEKKLQEDFTVRALTKGNPTMQKMFEDARNNADEPQLS